MHTQVATLVTDDRHTAQAVLVACICTHRLVWSPDTLYGAIHDAPIMPHEFGWEASVPLEEISADAAVTINTPVRCDCDKHVCAAILTHNLFASFCSLSSWCWHEVCNFWRIFKKEVSPCRAGSNEARRCGLCDRVCVVTCTRLQALMDPHQPILHGAASEFLHMACALKIYEVASSLLASSFDVTASNNLESEKSTVLKCCH